MSLLIIEYDLPTDDNGVDVKLTGVNVDGQMAWTIERNRDGGDIGSRTRVDALISEQLEAIGRAITRFQDGKL